MIPATDDIWLIDEARPPGADTSRALAEQMLMATRGEDTSPPLAIRLNDIVIHNNRKWFGEADIRLDALVVHGYARNDDPGSVYAPGTFRFSRVADGARLPADNLMIFHGRPRHFLDMFMTVSRDTRDSDDLATLLDERMRSGELKSAVTVLLGLAVAAPHVAALTAGLGAAAALGKAAYDVLRKATGATIGLYRCSWLEARDRFGIGRHPEHGAYRVNDLSFAFEVVRDEPFHAP